MSTKIRLQRHGKKGRPFYHIVVADSRSKRDGRFIEKLGTYNPNVNPASIELDFDRAVYWVGVGAEQSDSARAILSYRGVMMKDHLLRGVAKGAHTAEEAEAKFTAWMSEKDAKIQGNAENINKAAAEAKAAALAVESEKRAAMEKAIQAKNSELLAEAEAAAAAEAGEEVAEEAPAEEAEAPAAEEAAAPAAEEAKEEAPAAEEAKEEAPAAEEAKEEAPAAEEAKEEAPAAEEAKEEAPAAEEAKEEAPAAEEAKEEAPAAEEAKEEAPAAEEAKEEAPAAEDKKDEDKKEG